MTVVLDANVLLSLFRPEQAAAPRDPATGDEVAFWRDRLAGLVAKLERERSRIVIPAPALNGLLVRAGDATADLLREVERRTVFQIEAFDLRAAIEVALMTRHALDRGDAGDGATGPWAKVRYDRQIVAIAKVSGATAIYSDDGDVRTLGERHGIPVLGLADLPLPAGAAQGRLDLGDPPPP